VRHIVTPLRDRRLVGVFESDRMPFGASMPIGKTCFDLFVMNTLFVVVVSLCRGYRRYHHPAQKDPYRDGHHGNCLTAVPGD